MSVSLLLLSSGAFAGLINGWLGLGGMSVFVPLLIHLYEPSGVAHLMLKVLANAFVVALLNGIVAWFRYHRHEVVDYVSVRKISLGAAMGAAIAFTAAISLHVTAGADRLFGGYLLATGAFVALIRQRQEGAALAYSPQQCLRLGVAGGVISGLVGFNGNSFFAPFLRHGGLCIKRSVATAQVLGVLVSAMAVGVFWLVGFLNHVSLFDGHAIFLLAVSSSLFNLLGTDIKRRMSGKSLTVWVALAYIAAGLVLCLGLAHH